MKGKYTAGEAQKRIQDVISKYHQVADSIEAGNDMGAKGYLNPHLIRLLGALERLEAVHKAGRKGIMPDKPIRKLLK